MPTDLEKLTQPFPPKALKQRQGGGGKSLTYVETHTVIHRLNDATGNCWDFKLTRFDQVGDLYMAVGELTIPGLGTRTGIGVQRVVEKAGEDLVKGAASDCLKKCATLFGVGLELYGPDYEAVASEPPRSHVARPIKPEHAAELSQAERHIAARDAVNTQHLQSPMTPRPIHGAPKATPDQIQKLHGEGKGKLLDHDDLHALMARKGFPSIAEMTGDQIVTQISWLRAIKPSELNGWLKWAGRPTIDERLAAAK